MPSYLFTPYESIGIKSTRPFEWPTQKEVASNLESRKQLCSIREETVLISLGLNFFGKWIVGKQREPSWLHLIYREVTLYQIRCDILISHTVKHLIQALLTLLCLIALIFQLASRI